MSKLEQLKEKNSLMFQQELNNGLIDLMQHRIKMLQEFIVKEQEELVRLQQESTELSLRINALNNTSFEGNVPN
jgi:hypothetical protein